MVGESDFEGVGCTSDIVDSLFAGVDGGFINDVGSLTVAFQWAFRFVGFVAIAGGFFIFLSGCF